MSRLSQYGNYRQLNVFDRGRIVGLREDGFHRERLQIGLAELNPSSSIVCCYQIWTREGQNRRKRGTGKRGVTNEVRPD